MEHYGTSASAAAYMAAMGYTAWADATDTARTGALVRASRALDGRYERQFTGVRAVAGQARAWPRRGAYDACAQEALPADFVPAMVEMASYELAVIELAAPGSLSPVLTMGRLTKSEAVEGAGSRSFFGPSEMGITGIRETADAFRPMLTVAADMVQCFISDRRWVAAVV